jgi:hypothetical protein
MALTIALENRILLIEVKAVLVSRTENNEIKVVFASLR